jgi:hypothetical protein
MPMQWDSQMSAVLAHGHTGQLPGGPTGIVEYSILF